MIQKLRHTMNETASIEACIEDIDDFVATLGRYPPAVLALALRVHLAGLIRVLRERGEWSESQTGEFLRDLSGDALESRGA
jgi:hypothetical protein